MKFKYVDTLSEYFEKGVILSLTGSSVYVLLELFRFGKLDILGAIIVFFGLYGFLVMLLGFYDYKGKRSLQNLIDKKRSIYLKNNDDKGLATFNELILEIFEEK